MPRYIYVRCLTCGSLQRFDLLACVYVGNQVMNVCRYCKSRLFPASEVDTPRSVTNGLS